MPFSISVSIYHSQEIVGRADDTVLRFDLGRRGFFCRIILVIKHVVGLLMRGFGFFQDYAYFRRINFEPFLLNFCKMNFRNPAFKRLSSGY